MKTFVNRAILVCALMLSVAVAFAGDDKLAAILQQQRELAAKLDSADTAGMTKRQANQVRKAQAEIFSIAEGVSSLDQLNIEQRVRLDNALEVVNTQVKGTRLAAREQDICWRERPTGSKIEITRCGTEEEREEARSGARGYLERPRICTPPGCGN